MRRPNPNILWVYADGNPLNKGKGGNNRVHQLVKLVANTGNVTVLFVNTPLNSSTGNNIIGEDSEALSGVELVPFRLIVDPVLLEVNFDYFVKLVSLMKNNKFDLIIYSFPSSAILLFLLKHIKKYNALLIYEAHNVEKELYQQESISESRKKLGVIGKISIYVKEFVATKSSDYVLSISYLDKRKFTETYRIPPEKIIVIPPMVESKCDKTRNVHFNSSSKDIKIIFHGTYSYFPNKEAINIIRRKIAPQLRKYSNITFVISGKSVPKATEENIKLVGFVENLNELLSSCDIAIVPLKRGGGVKLKVLDYMFAGLPIVTTKKGAEGIGLVNGKHAIIVDDVNEDFIKAIEYLIENPKIRRKLGYNARKLAEKKYSITKTKDKLNRLFSKIQED